MKGLNQRQLDEFKRVSADPDLAVQAFFKIKNLQGNIVPFRYNRAQQLHSKRSTRFDYVIKARKVGISSRRFARDLWICATQSGQHRVLLTHTGDAAKKLLAEKIKPLHDNCIIPLGGILREWGYEFPATGSRYYIGTAGTKKFGRGDDISGYHASEFAHWKDPEVLTGVEEACTENADGLVETTANGHNFAKMKWEDAKKGQGRYRAIFLPWFAHEYYEKDASQLGILSEDEKRLMETFSLKPEQIAWRRWKIRDMDNPDLFPQEYPATDEEAFLTSGRLVFDWVSLLRLKSYCSPPKFKGDLRDKDNRIQLNENERGRLHVWKVPEPGHVYAIGADIAEGLEDGAYSVAEVIDLGDNEQVAEWHGHTAPDLFAKDLAALGEWYNWAMIIPEGWPGPGAVTVAYLQSPPLKYPKIWSAPQSQRVGFETNRESKPKMIMELAAAIRDFRVTIRSPRLLEEMNGFVYDAKGSMGPSLGGFSDCVMAFGIGWYASRDVAARTDYYAAIRPDFASQHISHSGGVTIPKYINIPGVRKS